MQITSTATKIHLTRYSGSLTEGTSRKTFSAKVGSFPIDVRPEFSLIDGGVDGKIPNEIYRSTTPDEHEEIINYVRNRRLSELPQRVRQTTSELAEIEALIPYAKFNSAEAKSLQHACAAMAKLLRKVETVEDAVVESPNAQIPESDNESPKFGKSEALPVTQSSDGE